MLRTRLGAGAFAAALALSAGLMGSATASAATTDPTTTSSTATTSGTATVSSPAGTGATQATCVADPDATAYAVQAFLAVGDDDAAGEGLAYLADQQVTTDSEDHGGIASAPVNGVAGTPNANTTGLAAASFGASGRAADFRTAHDFLTGLQQPAGSANAGAIAYDHAKGFTAATAPRATAQGVLGLVDTRTNQGTELLTLTNSGATDGNPTVGDDDVSPAQGAAGWLGRQLEINTDHLVSSGFDDWGLTADAVLAFDAAGVSQADARLAIAALEIHVNDYTGDPATGESYAGSLAKLIVAAEAQGVDPTSFGGQDLVSRLTAREVTSGEFAGRFSDESAYGDYSNAITQSLALIALLRVDEQPSSAALASLESLQCSDGGVAISYPEPTPPPTTSVTTTSRTSTSPRTSTRSSTSTSSSTTSSASASTGSTPSTSSTHSTGSTSTSPGHPRVELSDATVTPGQSITVTGTGFRAGETVRVVLHSTPIVLARLLAGPTGAVAGTVTIPADVPLGQHTIVLTGQDSGLAASTGLIVVQTLASTGVSSGVMGLGAIGAVLAVGGLLTLVVARRRRTVPATGGRAGGSHRS